MKNNKPKETGAAALTLFLLIPNVVDLQIGTPPDGNLQIINLPLC